jgi:ribosome biogenesis GTPase A
MRVGVDYEQTKQKTIRDYERYLGIRGDRDDKVDLKSLEQAVENLRKDRFSLAVAGEVSSGKSTFINALLGEYILPTDVLQNTCAVVEIIKSDEKYLQVTYAKVDNGSLKQVTYRGDEAITQLPRVASVPEEYRHIPFTLINSLLADGVPIQVSDEFMEELEQRSGIRMKGKEQLVRQYIEEFRDLSRIPVQVKLGYPIDHTVTNICIVDTPGVNAVGSIQDKTLAYINTANAILFVHPIKPVEAESFRRFLKENVTERSKEAMFLILSHAGVHPKRDIDSLLTEAKRIHHEIDPRQIIAVDSVLRLIEFDLQTKSAEKIMEDEAKEYLLAKYYRKATEKDELLRIVKAASNFEAVEDMIEELTARAPNLPIRDIYQRLDTGYSNQRDAIHNEVKLLGDKRRSPQDFERRISAIREKIAEYRLQANQLGENLHQKYLGAHGGFRLTIEQMEKDFSSRIDLSSSEGEVKKHLLDFMQASGKEALESVVARLVEECSQRMGEIGGNFKKQTDFAMPRVDVNALMQRASEAAYDTQKVKIRDDRSAKKKAGGIGGGILGGIIGFLIGGPAGAIIGAGLGAGGGAAAREAAAEGPVYEYRKSFNQSKFISNLKSDAKDEIKGACNNIPDLMRDLINGFVADFKQEVGRNETKLNTDLTKLLREQKDNQQLIAEINTLSSRLETVELQLKDVITVLANLR